MSTPLALVLDDNLLSSARITPQLKKLGWRVQLARRLPAKSDASGASSAETSSTETPELLLINLGSRRLGGLELLDECRARFPAARLLGFCGHLEVEIRREAKARGVHKLLTNEQAMAELAAVLPPLLPPR